MKTILHLFTILFCLSVTPTRAQEQEKASSINVSYEIGFVFTGQVESYVDSIDIVQDNQKEYFRFKRYNKYDLPVLMNAEDKTGKRSPLYLRQKNGRFTTGSDFKSEISAIHSRASQQQTKP